MKKIIEFASVSDKEARLEEISGCGGLRIGE